MQNDRPKRRREVAVDAALDQRFPQSRLGKLRISCSTTELPRLFADLRAARGRVYHFVLIFVLKRSGSLRARRPPRAPVVPYVLNNVLNRVEVSGISGALMRKLFAMENA